MQAECRVKRACYAEAQLSFAIYAAKLVKTEDKAKKKLVFICFVEVHPIFGAAKYSENRRQSKEICFVEVHPIFGTA